MAHNTWPREEGRRGHSKKGVKSCAKGLGVFTEYEVLCKQVCTDAAPGWRGRHGEAGGVGVMKNLLEDFGRHPKHHERF